MPVGIHLVAVETSTLSEPHTEEGKSRRREANGINLLEAGLVPVAGFHYRTEMFDSFVAPRQGLEFVGHWLRPRLSVAMHQYMRRGSPSEGGEP